jgi:hypothetical protein
LLQWKSNKYCIFWLCVCSLRYPARNSHVPYCHLWPVRLYHIFPHYLINGTIFVKKLPNKKCVLIFSTTFVCNVSYYKKIWAWYDQVCIGLHERTHYSAPILIKLEFSRQIFENTQISNCIKTFSETFLNLWRIQRDIIINVRRSSYEVPVILVRF